MHPRAVVCLASDPDRMIGGTEISESMDIPGSYVVKVLQQLVKADIVTSQRGKGGGFSLALPASEISLLAVINVFEPIPRIKKCPLNLPQHCKKLCPLHSKLDASYAQMEETFGSSYISEMIDVKPSTKRSRKR